MLTRTSAGSAPNPPGVIPRFACLPQHHRRVGRCVQDDFKLTTSELRMQAAVTTSDLPRNATALIELCAQSRQGRSSSAIPIRRRPRPAFLPLSRPATTVGLPASLHDYLGTDKNTLPLASLSPTRFADHSTSYFDERSACCFNLPCRAPMCSLLPVNLVPLYTAVQNLLAPAAGAQPAFSI